MGKIEMKDLHFLHDDNGSFADYSKDARDFLRDNFVVDYVTSEDALYIGLYKPFSSVYFEMNTFASVDVELILEKSTSSGFASIESDDDTKGFQRSGFIHFDRNDEAWEKATINGIEGFWVRIQTLADFNIDFQGVNIVFSDDNDLKSEMLSIEDYRDEDEVSFIAYQQASRNEIVQEFRNGGYLKNTDQKTVYLDGEEKQIANITKWDILDVGEIREASKYLTLAKIMFEASENTDDKAYQRHKDFYMKFGEAFKLFHLSLDKDDDGRTDVIENLGDNEIDLLKV
jgi:hypothetical protein